MNRGRFPLFTLLLFAALAPAGAVSPTVSNVRGLQQSPPSQFVDIYYTLADADSPTVRVTLEVFYLVSSGGTTTEVPIPATALSGAGIGAAVAPGPDKHIRWNAGADWPGQQSQTVRFRVIATDDPVILTGWWAVSFAGAASGSCSWDIVQTGTNFTITGACDFAGAVNFTGTINLTTGAFTASGPTASLGTATLNGTAPPAAGSMSGTYSISGYEGTFTAARTPPNANAVRPASSSSRGGASP